MKKYKIYVNSGYIYTDTIEKAFKLAKDLLEKNINVDLKVEDIEPQKPKDGN